MTAQDAYYTVQIVLALLGLAFYACLVSWFLNRYTLDTRKKGARERGWRLAELLPGPAGRRARVERRFLKSMGPHYAHKRKLKLTRRLIPINLAKHIKR